MATGLPIYGSFPHPVTVDYKRFVGISLPKCNTKGHGFKVQDLFVFPKYRLFLSKLHTRPKNSRLATGLNEFLQIGLHVIR